MNTTYEKSALEVFVGLINNSQYLGTYLTTLDVKVDKVLDVSVDGTAGQTQTSILVSPPVGAKKPIHLSYRRLDLSNLLVDTDGVEIAVPCLVRRGDSFEFSLEKVKDYFHSSLKINTEGFVFTPHEDGSRCSVGVPNEHLIWYKGGEFLTVDEDYVPEEIPYYTITIDHLDYLTQTNNT